MVLLLGVTRIQNSPVKARHPRSLSFTKYSFAITALGQNRQVQHSKSLLHEHSSGWFSSDVKNQLGYNPETCSNSSCSSSTNYSYQIMDHSVDSIGTCSLDMDVTADFPDWSENASVGTLRSVSLLTPVPPESSRLPSYLSLACTVNGYSSTTNYDPERLAKSRDTSPHRFNDYFTDTIQSNLLSPPNLVPLPIKKQNICNMEEQTISHHQEFYTSSKTVTKYLTQENRSLTSSIFSKDAVDACTEKKFQKFQDVHNKQMYSESKVIQSNGITKISVESVHEYKNGNENKSFIQQRVERLYGPGALAQGFFVTKRHKGDTSTDNISTHSNSKHSKSLNDDLLNDDNLETSMKQSSSSPALPVLRHLTPEFRAQLPSFTRKGGENVLQKSSTLPILKGDLNCHKDVVLENGNLLDVNGCSEKELSSFTETNCTDVIKDGHYFLKILEVEANRLLALADKAEEELNNESLSEDATGYIRSAAGKARLLVSQKMQQFKGLCANNITHVEGEAYPTTNEDLQGFWDMVMLQVDQIDNIYKELEILKSNNWEETKKMNNSSKHVVMKPRKLIVPRAQNAVAEEARKKREAQRKQILEDKRKAMKQQKQVPRQNIEIFMPEAS